jgi:hypothetical protein
MYVDEVGNPDLDGSDDPNHRFLSLTGVIVDLNSVAISIHPEMEALKARYFGSHPDNPVIFHRKEMLNRKPPFEALRDEAVRAQFDRDLLQHLSSWRYQVISVCLDKKNHRETYATWRYDPYHYCLALLLERYVFFLRGNKALGDVMAESRGKKEDLRLKASFRRLCAAGTEYVESRTFQASLSSRELKVKPKANNIAGLQIADLIAHPSRNEILHERGLLGRELPPFAVRVIEILRGKYYQRGGLVFGKKFL